MRAKVLLTAALIAPRVVLAQLVAEEVARFELEGVNSLGILLALDSQMVLLGAVGPGAYVFRFDGVWWRHEISIADPSTWGFGRTVALHESDALIRTNSANRGAYLFRIRELDW